MKSLRIYGLVFALGLIAAADLRATFTESIGPIPFTAPNQALEWFVDINFGGTAHVEALSISCTFTSDAGFVVEMYDMTRMARAGNAAAWNDATPIWSTGATPPAPGTYALTINSLDYQTLSLTGIHRVMFMIYSGSNAAGTFPNDVTLSVTNGAGAATSAGASTHNWTTRPITVPPLGQVGASEFFQRNHAGTALMLTFTGSVADAVQYEFDCKFGATPVQRSISVWTLLLAGTGGTITVDVYVMGTGYEDPPEISISVDPTTNFEAAATFLTPPLSGDQKIRVVVSGGGAFQPVIETLSFFTVESGVALEEAIVSPTSESPRMEITPGGSVITTTTPLSVTGGTSPTNYTWSLEGTVPTGVSLSATSGSAVDLEVTGTPPPASDVTVRCTNGSTGEFTEETFTVDVPPLPLQITGPASLPNGVENTFWGPVTVTATGGVQPYDWSATGLPPGLSIDPGTGEISGTPTAIGTFSNVVVTVTDNASTQDDEFYSIEIVGVIAITTTSLINGMEGAAYNADILATGGTAPYTWSVVGGNLPAGLSLDTSSTTNSTTITGIPTVNGTFNFTVRVEENGGADDDQPFTLVIDPPPVVITITTTGLAAGVEGDPYSADITVSGGSAPYTWSIVGGTLHAGLNLGASTTDTVSISGTPTEVGSRQITVRVEESSGAFDQRQFTLVISQPPAPPPPVGSSSSGSSGGTCFGGPSGGIPWLLFGLLAVGMLATRRRTRSS